MRLLPCRSTAAPLSLLLLLAVTGCAGRNQPAAANAPSYRVIWNVRRAADNIPLAGVTSPPLRVGAGELRVRTDSREPAENRPAFPEFLARLSTTRSDRRSVELVTRVSLREQFLTKKGKRKVSKRFIGALLPIRPGETLGVSGPGDPVAVTVRLEPGR